LISRLDGVLASEHLTAGWDCHAEPATWSG